MFDDGVDDRVHFGAGGFDRVGAGRGHPCGLDPAGTHGRVRGSPGHGDTSVLIAVAGEQQCDLVVETPGAGFNAQGGQDARERARRAVLGGGCQVVDDDQLVAARDDGGQLRQREAVCAVEHDHVDRSARWRKHGHHGGDGHEDGKQVSDERVGDQQFQVRGRGTALEEFAQLFILAGACS